MQSTLFKCLLSLKLANKKKSFLVGEKSRMLNGNFKFLLFFSFLILTFQVKAQLQANFSADTTTGCGSISNVQFTDLSSGNPTSWLWNFGNGNSSTLQNPTASYSSPGVYTVSLQVSNSGGTNQISKSNFIRVFRKPTASMTVGTTSGCPPLPVQFTSTSTPGDAAINTYLWDFGDGSQPATIANPNHTYQTGGNYPVSLQVTDLNNCSGNTLFNSINVSPAPVASFSTSNPRTSCTVPYTVNFVNNSSGSNLSFFWDFGDGTTSTQAAPSHTYQNLGNYTVSLRASDPNCSDNLTNSNYVQLQNVSTQFTLNKDTICFGSPFKPINTSVGATLYSWSFGDGKSSSQQSPSHLYADSGWYRVRLIASNGPICIDDYVDSVYVQRLFPSYNVSSNYVCNRDDSIVLSVGGLNVDSVKWVYQFGSAFASSSNNPLVLYQTFEGTFTDSLFVYSDAGCSELIVLDSNRTAEFVDLRLRTSPVNGCAPLKVKFQYQAFGPDTINQWSWNFGNGLSSTQQFPDSVIFLNSGTYFYDLSVVTTGGCRDSSQGVISVGDPQLPDFKIKFDSICPQDSIWLIDLSQDTSIIESYNYEAFTIDENQSIDFVKDSVQITNFKDTGYYSISLEVIDRGCKVRKKIDSAFFVEGPIVEIGYTPNCINRQSISFLGSIKGASRFYWDFGDSSALDSVNYDPVHLYDSAKIYKVYVWAYNDTNTCPMAVDSLEINLEPPLPLSIETDSNDLCIGDISRSTFRPWNYYVSPNWIVNGDTLSDSVFFLDSSLIPGNKVIKLALLDRLGCPHDTTDTIRIYEPKADFTSDVITGCMPLTVNFSDSGRYDTNIVAWRWDFGNQQIDSLEKPTATYTEPGEYPVFLHVENRFGCKDSILKQAYIKTEEILEDFIEAETNICQGESIYFRNLSAGNQISALWDFGDNSPLDSNFNTTHFFDSAGVFSVRLQITDSLGCVKIFEKNNLIQVQAKPQAAFSSDTSKSTCYPLAVNFFDESSSDVIQWFWTFGDASSSVFQNPFHNYTLPGKYDVSLEVETSNGCKDTVLKTQYIETEGPLASFTMDKDTICINESVNFQITSSNKVYSFVWDFGDGNNGTGNQISHVYEKTGIIYPTLVLSDSSGTCIVSIQDTLFVQPVKAAFSSSDTLGCGIPFSINLSNNSVGASQFLWNIAGNISSDANPGYTFNNYGNYLVELSIQSSIGCLDTARKIIRVSEKPVPTLRPDTGLCPGDSLELIAGGGSRYLWKPNQFISSTTKDTVYVFPDSSINYSLLAYNEAGCTDSTQIRIEVPQFPLNYEIFDSSIIIGESFRANVYSGLLFNYLWIPSTGLSCSDCSSPLVKPLETTLYKVYISDKYNCFSIVDSMLVQVDNAFSLAVPSAFSPNGDGRNDLIYARGWGIKELVAFRIYNRFGELVFETDDLAEGWDGTYKSKPQAIDTYVYTVEAISYGGEVKRKKGNISLLR